MFEDKNFATTPISELGEFGLIKRLTQNFQSKEPVIFGVGDDAAVIDIGENRVDVVSTDLLVEGIHFDLAYVPLQHLGYKAVVVNLSDVVAMGAKPYGVTLSIAVSNRFPVEALEELYAGVKIACDHYGITLMGGDTSSSRGGLILSVTAMGRCRKDKVIYRNGARLNDIICVSGDLGSAFAGLQILEREKAVFEKNPEIQPDLIGFDYVIGRQLKPEARFDVLQALEDTGVQPHSMIDISDGLASELFHIGKASGLGVRIYQEKIPIDLQTSNVADDFGIHPITYALNGGEDYQLLFTVKVEDLEKINKVNSVSVIGYMCSSEEGFNLINPNGQIFPLEAQGWKHF